MKINNYIPEKYLHAIFEIGVVLKGVDGVLEIIGAGLLFFVKAETLNAWLRFLTEHELSQDPKDAIANYLVSAGHRLFSGALVFAAVYLLAHGVVKILIVGGLLKNKLWAYPLGIIVFTAFVFYQLYRSEERRVGKECR